MTDTILRIATSVHRLTHSQLRGPRGPAGPQGPQGPKGDTGDVTTEAIAARDAAQEAASDAADSANLAEQARLLGATIGFATKAAMDADLAHAEGTLALVTNDGTAANNGTYRKTGASGSGSWVQSADRVTGLEGRVGTAESELDVVQAQMADVGAFRNGASLDLEVLTDAINQVVRRVDAAGQMFVPGIEEDRSVQQALQSMRGQVMSGSAATAGDVLQVDDASGHVVLRIDKRGGLYAPGMKAPVQALTKQTFSPATFPRTARESLHSSVKALMTTLASELQPFIPPPTMLVPNGYGVPDGFKSAFTVTQNVGVMLDTPYGDGGLVHPYLLEMRQPFLGYRFILSDTPHKHGNAWEENPVMYGSNDLVNFDLIPDLQQPMGVGHVSQVDYNSDDFLSYDPRDGKLILCWRGVDGSARYLRTRFTYDGVNWSDERQDNLPSANALSPSILYDPIAGLWRLWQVEPEGTVQHYAGPDYFGPWTLVGSENFATTHGLNIWHMEVKWLGTRFVIVANVKGASSNLYLGLSANGTNWSMGTALISPGVENAYKGTFLPEFDGDMARIHVAWNTYYYPLPVGMLAALHVVSSDWVDLTTL